MLTVSGLTSSHCRPAARAAASEPTQTRQTTHVGRSRILPVLHTFPRYSLLVGNLSWELVLKQRTPAMAESACWQCGQQGVVLKKCARCKNAAYCGAECQRLSWKQHKTACEVPLEEVCLKLEAAAHSEDWRGILTCEGRVEDLLDSILVDQDMEQKESDAACAGILDMFVSGHVLMIMDKRWSDESLLRFGKLAERRFALLANMELFRTQGEAMSDVGSAFFNAARLQQAATYLERARAVGAAHGFFSVESKACLGLGKVAVAEGRNAEGVAFLQNALAGSSPRLSQNPGPQPLNPEP